jgi:hypothetical protein
VQNDTFKKRPSALEYQRLQGFRHVIALYNNVFYNPGQNKNAHSKSNGRSSLIKLKNQLRKASFPSSASLAYYKNNPS